MSKQIKPKIKIDDYNEESFWQKCAKYAKVIGEELLRKALTLYYSLESPACTLADKAIIWAALAYLVSPFDAIPDITPFIGYSDDLGVIVLALYKIAHCIDKDVTRKVSEKLKSWFK